MAVLFSINTLSAIYIYLDVFILECRLVPHIFFNKSAALICSSFFLCVSVTGLCFVGWACTDLILYIFRALDMFIIPNSSAFMTTIVCAHYILFVIKVMLAGIICLMHRIYIKYKVFKFTFLVMRCENDYLV